MDYMQELSNEQKYENYRAQMGRLTHAIKEHFFLEAMFIEYAIMEDRCESILAHAGVFNHEKHVTITRKVRRLEALCQSNEIARKYFSQELLESILVWKEKRNHFIHALMKQTFTGKELEAFVMEGQTIIKTLSSKSTSFKRVLERQAAQEK